MEWKAITQLKIRSGGDSALKYKLPKIMSKQCRLMTLKRGGGLYSRLRKARMEYEGAPNRQG